MTRTTIAHLIETPGPGGAETVLGALVSRSDSAFRSVAFVPGEGSWLAGSLPEGTVRPVTPTRGASTGLLDVAYLRELRRLVRTEKPTVLHAHSFDSAVYASLAVRGLKTRMIATFHGASDVRRSGLRNRVKWRLLHRADALVSVSQALDQIARDVKGLPHGRLCVIHNGIDLERFTAHPNADLRSRLGVDPATILLGAVGNVRAPKGYDVLLHAIAALRASGVRVHLAVAGDDVGPLGDALRALRASLALSDCVSFVGFLDDVPAFLNGIDIYVLPSLSEGFSLSTVQALATALPVIATRSGGPEEIVEDGVSGRLVAPGSAIDLASAIGELVRNPGSRRQLALNARDRALSAFSVQEMVKRYELLYRRVQSRGA